MIFPKQGEFILPIADGRIKTPGGDQELRTSTLIRHRPTQEESNIDFLGESEGSLPQPQDSLLDAGEAINDFWSMSGNFIYRHHVEPGVKLYSSREESFLIPMKYIDASRTTRTNLDVKQEKRIEDFWNIDGSRDLSDSRTGFTQFTLSEEKPPDRFLWSGRETDKTAGNIQAISFMARALDKIGRNGKLKERQKWSNKNRNSIMPEDYEEFIPLTLRTRNSETWKPVNPQDCEGENLCLITMRTISQEKETIHCNIFLWYTNLFLCLKP